MFQKIWFSLVLIALFGFCSPAFAAVPQTMTYQGFLADSSGQPLNGMTSIAFSLYDVAKGGQPLWRETLKVPIKNGAFTAILGTTKVLTGSLFAGKKNLYLGVKVEQDPEMTPRSPLTSVPFARVAGNVSSGAILNVSSIKIAGKEIVNHKGEWKGVSSGLRGAKGDKGDTGAKGPKGDAGAIKSFSCPLGQFLSGISRSGTPICSNQNGTLSYKTAPSSWSLPSDTNGKSFLGVSAYSDTNLTAVFFSRVNNSDVMYVYYSTNAGQSWTKTAQIAAANLGAKAIVSLYPVSAGSKSFLIAWRDYSVKKSGVIQIYNNGKSWTNRLNTGNATNSMQLKCNSNGVCVCFTQYRVSSTYYNQLWRTTNGGQSWSKVWSRNGQNAYLSSLVASGTRFYFIFQSYNSSLRKHTYQLYYSDTSGSGWKVSLASGAGLSLRSVQGDFLTVDRAGKVLRSTNGGGSFASHPNLFSSFPSATYSNCYVLGSTKQIFCNSCFYRQHSSLTLPYQCVKIPQGISSFPRSVVSPSGRYIWYLNGGFVYRWMK